MRHNKLDKELSLILLLSGSQWYTVEELCNMLQISSRSAYYYLNFLRDFGFVIEKAGTRWRISRQSPFLQRLSEVAGFTEDEAIIIRRLLEQADRDNAQIGRIKAKLERFYDLDILNNVQTNEEQSAIITTLYNAMKWKKMAILYNYSSSNSDTRRSRVVEPFTFLNDNKEVRCYEINSKMNKTFKISRIERAEVLDDAWANEHKHRNHYTDIFMFSGDTQHHVVLHLDRLAYNIITEEYPKSIDFIEQIGDSNWQLSIDVCSFKGIGRFVLGLSNHITAIENDDFKEYLRQQMESIRLLVSPAEYQFGSLFQFFIPCSTEGSCQRFFQKTIHRQFQFSAFCHCCLAHRPAVIVECRKSIAQLLGTYGIKCTTDGFTEADVAMAVGLFQCAVAAAILMAGKHAVLAIADRGNQIALFIGVCHALPVYHLLRTGMQVAPHHIQCLFYLCHFLKGYGCSRIAFHTANAMTGIQVAAKILCNNVGRQQHVAHLYNWECFHRLFFTI